MKQFQPKLHLFLASTLALTATSLAQAKPSPDDIKGDWIIIDEIYGNERAIGRVKKDRKGNYIMYIVKNNTKMADAQTHCKKCPGKFKNKPIMNLPIMWNITPVKGKPRKYAKGFGLDPYQGTMFKGELELSKSKNTLKIRATPLETSFVGKKFVFIRKR